jgi:hypothetical protein
MLYLLFLALGLCHGLPKGEREIDHDVPTSVRTFLVVGDQGATSRDKAERVGRRMNEWAGENGCDFILSLGDNFYQDGPPSVNDELFEDRWINPYSGDNIKDLFWFISVGNHDYYPYEGYEWNEVARTHVSGEKRWYLPELWYNQTLDSPAGKIDLIVADSQAARKAMNDYRDMYTWFENTLKWSDEEGHMKIVVSHHPSRSAGNYYPGSGTIQNNFEPHLVTYNADFFLNGHDHNMQHISFKNGNGPEMLIIGGGGAGLYGETSGAASGLDRDGFRLEKFVRAHGFAGVTVTSSGIRFDLIDEDGDVIHTVTRAKKAK